MPLRPNPRERDRRRPIVEEIRRARGVQRETRQQMADQMHDQMHTLVGRLRHQGEPPEVIWSRLERSTPRARREVDRIVEAAIDVADEEGLEALSMRRLARTLGTGTTSLYRYVLSKEELLTLMVDAVNAPDPFRHAPSGDWRAMFTTLAHEHRQQLLDHPWLAGEISSRPAIGPNTLRAADEILRIASAMGLDGTTARSVVGTLLRYVRGAVSDELAELDAQRRTGLSQDEWRRSVRPYVRGVIESGRYPSFAAAVTAPEPTDDEQFQFGLARLLDGFEVLASEAGSPD